MSNITRRQALSVAGLTLGAGAFTTGFASSSLAESTFSPKYIPVSPEKAAALAYDTFPQGACMFATIKSIVTLVAEKNHSAVPPVYFDMFKYGHGGCGMWGTLCGTCNGGAAVIGLFHQDKIVRDGLIGRLFRWYESTELPCFVPLLHKDKPFPKASAQSVLCHLSIDSWCKEADEEPFSSKQKERCRRLAADVAKKVVEILNDQHEKEKGHKELQAKTSSPPCDAAEQPPQSCIACHSTPGKQQVDGAKAAPKSIAKMNCATCHEMKANHPE